MCCFKYEQEAYEDAHRRCPAGRYRHDGAGTGRVIGVHLLKETLTVRLDLGNESDLLTLDASLWRCWKHPAG
jgi:cell fate regulator YaaT (PSP1 superfamily)